MRILPLRAPTLALVVLPVMGLPAWGSPGPTEASGVGGVALPHAAVVLSPVLPRQALAADSTPQERARARQAAFEAFRISHIPVRPDDGTGSCDQQIGRICIWFGGEGENRFPREIPEVGEERRALISLLSEALDESGDAWIRGQLVRYLVEERRYDDAVAAAQECDDDAAWWCAALEGYVEHVRFEFVAAEASFRRALDLMPSEERTEWITPRYILPPEEVEAFEAAPPAEQIRRFELFWRLSDPLFIVAGNDRLTDHFARLVQVRLFEDAANPQDLPWGEDLAETLVRYGRIIGWSRVHDPRGMSGAAFRLEDTRRVLGHHHPRSRGYLFPSDFLASPSDVPPESWITAPRRARTWYAPPYAPDFHGLETQVGRFRRDDAMLVVGAYHPDPADVLLVPGQDPPPPPGEVPVNAALVLVPVDGGPLRAAQGRDADGVFTLEAPPGRYVASLEVLDARGRRAWRARQGVAQLPLTPGLVTVSDLVILKEDAPLPATLEEAIPQVRAGIRVRSGETLTVVWEVYGLRVAEPIQVTLGFTRGRPGFLARVGEFLGVLQPDRPVEVTFEDAGPDEVQAAFRAVHIQVPAIEPGEYTLHLRVDLPGREPAIASRPIVVEG